MASPSDTIIKNLEQLPPFPRVMRVAALFDFSRTSAYGKCANGEWPCIRTGERTIRVDRDGLIEWVHRQRRNADNESAA